MKLDKDFPYQRDVGQAVIETTIKPIVSKKISKKVQFFYFQKKINIFQFLGHFETKPPTKNQSEKNVIKVKNSTFSSFGNLLRFICF